MATFLLGAGCHVQIPKKRGLLFRGDWAFEINRTPWVGCPPESGCDLLLDEEGFCEDGNCLKCDLPHPLGKCKLRKMLKGNTVEDDEEDGEATHEESENADMGIVPNLGKFRRHCGQTETCTRKRPCCSTPGCGVVVDPNDPKSMARAGYAPGMITGYCGLTPGCSLSSPCGLTPRCCLPVMAPSLNPASVGMMGNVTQQPYILSAVPGGGIAAGSGMIPIGSVVPAGGILPRGGIVGINGMIHRSCGLTPQCSAARPCGLTPQCGVLVPPGMAQQNVILLAGAMGIPANAGAVGMGALGLGSGASPQRVSPTGNTGGLVTGGSVTGAMLSPGGVQVSPGGMMVTADGRMVNPAQAQIVQGLTMSGYPQTGYPPIGYAESGYSPGYPRQNALQLDVEEGYLEAEVAQAAPKTPQKEAETAAKSSMPAPRHHPLPTRPTFERSQGLSNLQKEPSKSKAVAKTALSENTRKEKSDQTAVIQQAYLQGMIAMMKQQQHQQQAHPASSSPITPVSYNAPMPGKVAPFAPQGSQNPYAQNPYNHISYGDAPHSARQQGMFGNPLSFLPSLPGAGNQSGTPFLGLLGIVKDEPAVNAAPPVYPAGMNVQALQEMRRKQVRSKETAEEARLAQALREQTKRAELREMQVRKAPAKTRSASASSEPEAVTTAKRDSRGTESVVEHTAGHTAMESGTFDKNLHNDGPLPDPQRKVATNKRRIKGVSEDAEKMEGMASMGAPVKPPTLESKRYGSSAPMPPLIQQANYDTR
ncbi:MAG TPA: hypothetical protein DEB39_09135 [Planctomycetaceae bacterium]|nr:hypothetical protein [Planctomycetaceae bacterium]